MMENKLAVWCITRSLLDGSIGYGDACDISDELSEGCVWSRYNAINLAMYYGVRAPGTCYDGSGWGPNY